MDEFPTKQYSPALFHLFVYHCGISINIYLLFHNSSSTLMNETQVYMYIYNTAIEMILLYAYVMEMNECICLME
jgi:hypothetical protein